MLFNPCLSLDFEPNFEVDGNRIDIVDQTRLLGVTIQSDLRWQSNTKLMIEKAYKRL